MVDMADGLRVALGSKALDLVKGKIRAGGDDQVVVVDAAAVSSSIRFVLGIELARRATA